MLKLGGSGLDRALYESTVEFVEMIHSFNDSQIKDVNDAKIQYGRTKLKYLLYGFVNETIGINSDGNVSAELCGILCDYLSNTIGNIIGINLEYNIACLTEYMNRYIKLNIVIVVNGEITLKCDFTLNDFDEDNGED